MPTPEARAAREAEAREQEQNDRNREAALARLHDLQLQIRHIHQLIDASAEDAREAGATWDEIGTALFITKQGAQKRFGKSS